MPREGRVITAKAAQSSWKKIGFNNTQQKELLTVQHLNVHHQSQPLNLALRSVAEQVAPQNFAGAEIFGPASAPDR
jgi:hypothetical protein